MFKFKFYDTCSLLLRAENLFDNGEKIVISSITLSELENIKTSATKDADIKYAARRLLHTLDEHPGAYEVEIFTTDMLDKLGALPVNEDTKILATAIHFAEAHELLDVYFVTNDLALKNIAGLFFDKDHIESVDEDDNDDYTGYKQICLNEDEMSFFYSNPDVNPWGLNTNEYLIVGDDFGEQVDTVRWDGEKYVHLTFGNLKSKHFGNVKPLKGDIYQAMFIDSLLNNQITMVKGPAGSGKTYISMAYLFHLLEKGEIDKIIVFCNTVATKNSAKLGYYPGTRDEKLLDSQIGNLLISKFGGRMFVEQMIEDGTLLLLPLSDVRGYDTSGMNAGVYISEAQNMDINLMKLALQRIGEDCICIIDGDCKTQVDKIDFAGANNGMRRVSKVFRGEDIYGEVELKNIHRSRIAEIAEKL